MKEKHEDNNAYLGLMKHACSENAHPLFLLNDKDILCTLVQCYPVFYAHTV